MTSNLGSQYAFEEDKQEREKHYRQEVEKFFRPEFINRIDEIIVFNALDAHVMKQIAEKFLNQLRHRLSERDIHLEVTDKALDRMIALGTDADFGARPMKRHIQRAVETVIAKRILETPDIMGKTIAVDADDEGYIVSVKRV